jgi:hypothetical protein
MPAARAAILGDMMHKWTVAESAALAMEIIEARSPLLVRCVLMRLERGDVTISEAAFLLARTRDRPLHACESDRAALDD